MISSGYFGVTREKLSKMSVPVANQFLWEMLTCGGRISYDEYRYWLNWLLKRGGLTDEIR